jgi:hypothetical protein
VEAAGRTCDARWQPVASVGYSIGTHYPCGWQVRGNLKLDTGDGCM